MQKNSQESNSPTLEIQETESCNEKSDINQWSKTSACINDIFSGTIGNDIDKNNHVDSLDIFPNYSKLKVAGQKVPGNGGRRGKVTSFTKTARARMIQRMASMIEYPDIWQDFTFPDDVMENKSIEDRAIYSSKVIKRFKREVEGIYLNLFGVWRREWEPRKSGKHKGEECPHFHALFKLKGINEHDYIKLCVILGEIWVRCTGTKETEKALKVALNGKSYRWLSNKKMAQIYVSKYVAKVEIHNDNQSRGRFWGKIGNLPLAEGLSIRITGDEAVFLRRLFRAKIRSRSKNIFKIFQSKNKGGWLLISAETILRMLEWIRETITARALNPPIIAFGIPF